MNIRERRGPSRDIHRRSVVSEQDLRRYNAPIQQRRAVDELRGAAAIIVFDGRVSDDEVFALEDWLTRNLDQCGTWPLSDLAGLLESIVADRIITGPERTELFSFLKNLTGDITSPNLPIGGIFEDKARVPIRDRIFCFTGEMKWASRDDAISAVLKCGGRYHDNLVLDTDFLVVGDRGSEFWRESNYGTKIEKAMRYQRDHKSGLMIIKEARLIDALISAGFRRKAA